MRLSPALSVLSLAAALIQPAPVLAETATAGEVAPATTAEALPAITVTTASPRQMSDRVIASGLVGPVEEVLVQPLIEGQPIQTLLADVGDRVEAGQVLATLSKTTLDLQRAQGVASLAAARATIAQAEAQQVEAESSAAEAARIAERTNTLRKQGSASQAAADTANANAVSATARVTVARQSLEAARAQLALTEAQLANIDLQLTRTEVKAPVAGLITAREATVGAIATAAGKPMFAMEKNGALELRADIAESDLLRLAVGQTATLIAAGLTDRLTGTIRIVEPSIDLTTRLGRARIAVDDPEKLRSGMFVEADILVAQREALAVPVTAVGSDNGDATVMRVRGGVVERVVITTGIRDAGYIEVLSGLTPGDQLVAKAGSFVRTGDHITPVPMVEIK
ncbi:MAG: efflux RND transporter periplasmic adaptor subunit [Paracoccaceae bacterium]